MARLLFDTPWWLPTMLAGIGLFLFWTGNRRQERRVRDAGIGLLLAAIAVLAISYLVDTPVERAVEQSKELTYSVERRDWNTMRAILDPACELTILGAFQIYDTRDDIIAGAQAAVERYGLRNVRILSATGEQTDTLITVTLSALSEQDTTMGRPIPSTWTMEWQQTGRQWSLVRITCQNIGDMRGSSAGQQFPRVGPREGQ